MLMKSKFNWWSCSTLVLSVVTVCLLALLRLPAKDVRLHGTYAQSNGNLHLTFYHGQSNNVYAIYPQGHPYKSDYVDEGSYRELENGIVELIGINGNIYYAVFDHEGDLWLYHSADSVDFYNKFDEAAIF